MEGLDKIRGFRREDLTEAFRRDDEKMLPVENAEVPNYALIWYVVNPNLLVSFIFLV